MSFPFDIDTLLNYSVYISTLLHIHGIYFVKFIICKLDILILTVHNRFKNDLC